MYDFLHPPHMNDIICFFLSDLLYLVWYSVQFMSVAADGNISFFIMAE